MTKIFLFLFFGAIDRHVEIGGVHGNLYKDS